VARWSPASTAVSIEAIVGTRVAAILAQKGREVVTIGPRARLDDAAQLLTRRGIGAVVVCDDDGSCMGVLSERDVVTALAHAGAHALERPVAGVMQPELVTCHRGTTTDELVAVMTARRARHVPVVESGRLLGIVSIGDVVKARMDELATEAGQLQDYVRGRY
jgi:CBS domain-containing protein